MTFAPTIPILVADIGGILGCMAEFVGQNGAFQQQAGESVTRGDRRRRELEARSSSPPLACLLLECWAASAASGDGLSLSSGAL